MRAASYERTGPASEVLTVGELPTPTPGPGEVRVKVQWSGINPSDVKSRGGMMGAKPPFPRIIPHSDGSGVIDAVGDGVARERVGERVWTWNAAWGRPFGTAAQYVVLPEAQAVALPEGVPLEAGACLGIPALTAYHAVATDGGVLGKSVLVTGGAGGVGHYAIQIARLLGARQVLTTVSSPEKARLAQEAGADAVLDYKREDVPARVKALTGGRGVDRIIEVDLAANLQQGIAALRADGEWVVYGSGVREVPMPFGPLIFKNIGVRFFIVYHLNAQDRARALEHVTSLLARGALQHNIAARLPLARIADGHALVEGGKALGNVVLQVD
ncbi:NADPH:quinone reductase [Aggregicoccus sp. 17bor-14]|uniref:NADPH:quinone reductase n=1 Tax=Myxococcaceae TaxID=31 RepID=UPI00129C76C7|nr:MULTISPECIES: NADPH:quinone reductase [Myxococcaceae]MBF5046132.1 NADPH:quinone reductase [Simulacricoccus sp. 17bor-14]MRI91859.1 NADPH:quinone reductase [Aggregicoccus sp. 17bor-14]